MLSASLARAADYSLREWHGEDGLPSEVLQGVVQDQQGFLWVAADIRGVTRFNGLSFAPPRSAAAIAPTLYVRSLVKHPVLGILFSTNSGEIWQWDGAVLGRHPLTEQFSKQPVQAWLAQLDGTLWAALVDGRVEYLQHGVVRSVTLEGVKIGRTHLSMAADAGGVVWITGGNLLFRVSGGEAKRVIPPWRETELRVTSSRSGLPWVIARDFVGRWNGRGVESAVQIPELLGAHFVRAMFEDREGNLWVGTRSQGAYLVTGKGYEKVPSSHRTVTGITQDDEGNIWLATGGAGLNRLQEQHFKLYNTKSGLLDDQTLSVCEDRQGRVWLANRDGGLARVRGEGVELMSGRNQWPRSNAGRVASDPSGGIWFIGNAGLYRIGEDDSVARMDTRETNGFRVLHVARSGELWIAGEPEGLGRFANGLYTAFDAASGIASQQVNCIAETTDGAIIVGTSSGLLLRHDGGRFVSLRPGNAPPLSPVRVVLIGKDGVIWVGTATGLIVIEGGREHRLAKSDGLPDDMISQMLLDDNGAVWLGTPLGIFRLECREVLDYLAGRATSVRVDTFGKNEGFAHISCIDGYQPNSVKARDGTLWFTTRLGALAINPIVAHANRKIPVHIDEWAVDGVPHVAGPLVRVRSDMHKLEIRFSVLNFAAPERTPVRYRLEGFDQDWVELAGERKAVFPRLAPGSYRLQVASISDSGDWDEPGATLQIIVVPYWWQTLWFKIVVSLLAGALFVVWVRAWAHRRLRKRLEQSRRESALHRERTRIARDIHDELGASLTRISLLAQSAPPASTDEETRGCFDEIYTTTSEITRSIDEIVWAVDARHDNLDSLVNYLDSYAQGFLSVAKIRYRLDAPREIPALVVSSSVRHNLFLAFKEALNNCVRHAGASEVLVRVEMTDGCLQIKISDNGRGLDREATVRPGGGKGLTNLATRMEASGGRFSVQSNPAGGTEIVLTVPHEKLNP